MSNFQTLANLSNYVLEQRNGLGTRVSDLINNFLKTNTRVTYQLMVDSINDAITSSRTAGLGFPVSRVIVVRGDGTVVYQTNSSNTWNETDGVPDTITDNHNTRPEIMSSLLSTSGSSQGKRYSSTTSADTLYNSLRLGASSTEVGGTYRISTAA